MKCQVTNSQPFEVTGVDLLEHFMSVAVRENRRFMCAFTCAVSRAIHQKFVLDLTMESFIQVFCCFASQRSLPKSMLSDNASTYLAATEEL